MVCGRPSLAHTDHALCMHRYRHSLRAQYPQWTQLDFYRAYCSLRTLRAHTDSLRTLRAHTDGLVVHHHSTYRACTLHVQVETQPEGKYQQWTQTLQSILPFMHPEGTHVLIVSIILHIQSMHTACTMAHTWLCMQHEGI